MYYDEKLDYNAPMISTRDAYGEALNLLANEVKNLVVLDADLSSATKTIKFREKYPDRHINCGIAEANMTGVAAGLALSGFIPVISSFAMFVTGRNYEQIRNSICYPHLNVKIIATHAGITVGEDGATHQCNEDIALMRAIPGMTVVVPCDKNETICLVRDAIQNYVGPVYIRLGRAPVRLIHKIFPDKDFKIGKGIKILEGNDITIIATGLGVSIAQDIYVLLREHGIYADVINIHTIKPIDNEIIISSAKKTRKVVTIEEHSIIGGLGDAVADILVKNNYAKLLKMGVNDYFGFSGDKDELLRKFVLHSHSMLRKIKDFFYMDFDI